MSTYGRHFKPQIGPAATGFAQQPHQLPKGAHPPGSLSPGGTAQPLDSQYESYLTQARYQRGLSDADAAYQTGQVKQEYGVEDQSNPYSRAALLRENYQRSIRGTTNSYAAQGQGSSGAAQRMQGENARNYSIGADRNARDYQNAIHGIQYGQAQTVANYGTGMDDAAYQALLRALGGQ